MWGKGILDMRVRWRVGSGNSIRIYDDKWIPRQSTFKILSPPKLGSDARVSELVSSSGGWNTQLIKQNFCKQDVDAILQIPVISGSTVDMNLWHFKESGNYTVKNGYWIGRGLGENPGTSNTSILLSWWKTLWKLAIP
ncbi:hypothetical protein Ddye_002969 [Dipteronia dyeriana]|uniref:GH10 domain-containing protein n=1 Tax=Dipteronia dyeriana TaxID=168575 RepID=A0AAD9XRU0_9ROSI|nr:hypothetical protein Ddye_002969 [Dipteronia dyeriana]